MELHKKLPLELEIPQPLPYASLCLGESFEEAKYHKTTAQGLARLRYINRYIRFPRGGYLYKLVGQTYVAHTEWFPNVECIDCGLSCLPDKIDPEEDEWSVGGLAEYVLNRRHKPYQWRLIHHDCLRAKYGYDCGGCDTIHLPNDEGRAQAILDYGL